MDNDQEVVREPFEYEESKDDEFAKSFGIQLKDKTGKNEHAYDKLIKSTHFQASDKSKPLIETSVTSDCIYHKGTYYQKGDIVSLYDQEDGQIYFAQLTGFLQDQYCEKSASVNWLVPIKQTSRKIFDPSAYIIGLEDTRLRKMECMTFVRHCPHDYYLKKMFQSDGSADSNVNSAGHSLVRSRSKKDQNYIWTTMKPCRVPAYGARKSNSHSTCKKLSHDNNTLNSNETNQGNVSDKPSETNQKKLSKTELDRTDDSDMKEAALILAFWSK